MIWIFATEYPARSSESSTEMGDQSKIASFLRLPQAFVRSFIQGFLLPLWLVAPLGILGFGTGRSWGMTTLPELLGASLDQGPGYLK